MGPQPEPVGCLDLLGHGHAHDRLLGWRGDRGQQCGSMPDALHNIVAPDGPRLLK